MAMTMVLHEDISNFDDRKTKKTTIQAKTTTRNNCRLNGCYDVYYDAIWNFCELETYKQLIFVIN